MTLSLVTAYHQKFPALSVIADAAYCIKNVNKTDDLAVR